MRELDERGVPEGYPFQDGLEMTAREASEALKSRRDGFILIDCREPFEVAMASVEGALHIPKGDTPARLNEIDADEDTPIGVLCHTGVRSLHVARFLQEQGLSGARSIVGGIELWSIDVDPGVPRYTK